MFQVIFEMEINKTNKMPNQDIKLELRDSLWKVKFFVSIQCFATTHTVCVSELKEHPAAVVKQLGRVLFHL